MIRDLSLNDLRALEKDGLPSLFNGPFKLIKSVECDGKLIGSFWVKITSEISILLKPELSNLAKAKAIKEIGEFLYGKIPEQLGISEAIVVFDNDDERIDERYIKFLKKHFNFEEVKALRVRRNDAC